MAIKSAVHKTTSGNVQDKKAAASQKPPPGAKKVKALKKKDKEWTPSREIGGKINEKVDKVGNMGKGMLKEGINEGKKIGKQIGASDKLVNHVGNKVQQGGTKLINHGIGQAKNFIHNNGKRLINEGVEGIKSGAKRVGSKISEGFENLKKKFKR